jgi:hypothetical protein
LGWVRTKAIDRPISSFADRHGFAWVIRLSCQIAPTGGAIGRADPIARDTRGWCVEANISRWQDRLLRDGAGDCTSLRIIFTTKAQSTRRKAPFHTGPVSNETPGLRVLCAFVVK